MRLRSFLGLLAGVSVLGVASLSHAQCTKDTDCKGERVCEAGACVTPALPPAPAAPVGAEAAPAAGPAVAPVPAAAAPAAPPPVAAAPMYEPPPDEEPVKLKPRRHSTGMMVGGIVMVSFVPIALLVSLVANAQQSSCESGGYYYSSGSSITVDDNCDKYDKSIYGGAIVAVALLGAGIPMIAIGAKREPAATARITPWASPQAAGLKLRLDL
jgi:hypothetical protein